MHETPPAARPRTTRAEGCGSPRTAALALALLALTGCPNGTIGPPPRTVEEAVDRVNTNLSKIDAPLYCKDASVTFSFRDSKGVTQTFRGHPATIIFQSPRDLYFDIKKSLLARETAARIGSNSDLYWFLVDVGDTRKLWFGEWAALDAEPSQRLPIPPSDLLDALMLRPLPRTLAGGVGPVLRIDGADQRLVYLRVNERRESIGAREIRLDPYPPQFPVEIIDRDRNGRVLMHAWLSDYKRVLIDDKPTGPWTARKYRVEWPVTGASMRLDIDAAKFRPDQPPAWDFPADWTGEMENLDEPPPGGVSQVPASEVDARARRDAIDNRAVRTAITSAAGSKL